MADGKNTLRAKRILDIYSHSDELSEEFQRDYAVLIRAEPQSAIAQLPAYNVFSRERTQYRLVRSAIQRTPRYDPDQVNQSKSGKRLLQQQILVAAASRFQLQIALLKAMTAARYTMNQQQFVQDEVKLRESNERLNQVVEGISEQIVFDDLRQVDQQRNSWTDEDPDLSQIVAWTRTQKR